MQIQELVIDPKYLESIPRPSEKRYNEIKQDISDHGQHLKIIVNQKYVILDGHTRYQICQELEIKPKYEIREFHDKLQEERFVYSLNVKRRDLPDFVHIELSLKIHDIDAKIAKENQIKGGQGFQISEKAKLNTTKTIAKETKKSIDTVSRVKKITEHATKQEIQDLRNGKDGISINKIFKKIKKQEKKKKRHEEIKKIQVKLPKNVTLYNQDFNKNKIKDNSISLIFTDPPYTKEFLHVYEELAKQAIRVLKDGGSLMCYIGHYALGIVIPMMEKHGLKFHWPIAVIHSGPSSTMWGYKVMVGYKLMLWFTKGKYEGEFVRDVIKSEFQGKELHEWAQSTIESDYYIKQLTIQNEIVYDPFLGQGTFGISAVKLNRQFIGSEINKEHFDNAQRLLTLANSEVIA